MDIQQNYMSLVFDLENQELASSGNCSKRVYAQLLAIYLLSKDLSNAKLLWKRIPEGVKKDSVELQAIWKIGKQLLQRNLSEIYLLIDSYQWPNFLCNIMKELKEEVKKSSLYLVQKSYSYIRQTDLKKLLNLTSDQELNTLIESMNWKLDGDEGVYITKSVPTFETLTSNQEHLEKLAEYVAFLEN